MKFMLEDFLLIQRQSFLTLIEKGISEEIEKRNPITNSKKDLEVLFLSKAFKLSRPEFSIKNCILKSQTYSSKIYVPVLLIDKKSQKIQMKWSLLGHLPLMTKRGHFFINGAARIIINQMIRSPGVYFQEKFHEVYQNSWNEKPTEIYKRYYADLICLKGTWLRLEIDKHKVVWAQTKKGPKIPVLWLLLAMGLSEKRIYGSIKEPKVLLKNFEMFSEKKAGESKYRFIRSTSEAWKEIYYLISTQKIRDENKAMELGRKWIFKKFMNPRAYDMGKQGRLSFNKKLGLAFSLDQTTLTAQDVLFTTNYLLQLEDGFKKIDDIDHLKNRRVRTSGELIQIQIAIGLLRLERLIREKINNPNLSNLSLYKIINTKPINGSLREFFGSSPLSQFMDQINPLSEITHKRRLSSLGPGGVSRDNATLAIRGIHPTHYGRICPVETPEGKNTGLVNSLTTYAKVNHQGLLETPFYRVYCGQVQKQLGFFFLSAEQEEKVKVATPDLLSTNLGFLPKANVPIRFGENFTKISRQQIHWVGVSSNQMVSIATSLIPFLEHDDANRALMGSNMQRQAVPILRPERPIVGTNLEARVASDSGHAFSAQKSGWVGYVSGQKIILYTFLKDF